MGIGTQVGRGVTWGIRHHTGGRFRRGNDATALGGQVLSLIQIDCSV